MNLFPALLGGVLLATASYAKADLADELARLVGYSIIYSGTVTGYREASGKKSDDFEGCDFGRRLIIDDRYTVECATYSYTYAYRPTAVILSRGSDLRLVVEDELYDVRK